MLSLFKVVSRNKFFYVFALLIIIMFPSALYLQSDKDTTVIVTTIGIDVEEDKVKVSALAIIPNAGGDISSNLELFEGEGDTLSEAFNSVANNTGKKIGLAHCDCIAMSKKAMENNMTEYLDYFIRPSNLTTNASLIGTDGKASDLLSATKSSNKTLDLNLRNIVEYKEERTLLESINIEKFYRQYYSESATFYIPMLSTEESDDQSSGGSSGGGSGGSEESSGGGSSGGGSSGSQGQKKIVDKDKIGVIFRGKYVRDLDEDELLVYSILAKQSDDLPITIDNVTDEFVTDSKETYEQINKLVIPKYSFEQGTPTATYKVYLNLRLDEINGANYSYDAINGLNNFLSDTVKEEINKQVQEKLVTTVSKMKKDKLDILDLYTKFNAYKHSSWSKYLATLSSPADYLQGVDVRIELHLFNAV